MTDREGIAEHFPRRVSGATRPKDPDAPDSTQDGSPADEHPVATAGESPADTTEEFEIVTVETEVDAAAGDSPQAETPPGETAAVTTADEAGRVEGVAGDTAPGELTSGEAGQDSGEREAMEATSGEARRVEDVGERAATQAASGEAGRVEDVEIELADVGERDGAGGEPAEGETSLADVPPRASAVETSLVEPASLGPSSAGSTDALPRAPVSSSQDAEDTRALQTTLDGEGQRSFIARAQVLGANAWRGVDLGTGLGDIAIALARALPGLHLMAIDSSAAMLRIARRKQWMMNTNVTFIRGDAQATGLSQHSCDLVLAHGVVHHLEDPAALFLEVARIASDDAAIYICDLQRPETPEALERALEAQAEEWSDRQRRRLADAMRASLRADEVQALCAAAGLTGVEVRLVGEHRWEVVRARRR